MSEKKFFLSLVLATALSVASHFIIDLFFSVSEYIALSMATVCLMVVLSLLVYFLSIKATKSENKSFFINVIIINVMLKLFCSIILIVLYTQMVQPSNKYFVLPFLLIYLIFTIFETIFLSKQSRIVK